MKKIYIVTGAAGFLGNNIIRKLEQNKDNEIRALVLPQEKTVSLEGLNCKIYNGDVTKKESLDVIFNVGESDAEIYDFYVKSYIGMINESISIVSIIMFFIKERKKPNEK